MANEFERHEGIIHDRVGMGDGAGGITVIAGDEKTDAIGVQVYEGSLITSTRLTPTQAIRLGRLLIAAGEDTLSRPSAPVISYVCNPCRSVTGQGFPVSSVVVHPTDGKGNRCANEPKAEEGVANN